MAVRVIKPAMEPEFKDSPYITLLASILLLFSLYLLYHHHFNAVQNQDEKKAVVKKGKRQEEHLVRIITLRPKPDKPKARSKPKARPSAVPHATAKTISKGRTPAIDATFAMPIQRYLKIIRERAGAKVLLFDAQKGQMIGEVIGDQFIMGNMKLNGMSMQARDITADLSLKLKNRVLRLADAKSSKPYKFLIVLPSHAEQRFTRLLAEQLTQRGIRWSDVSSLQLQYREWNHHIVTKIKTVMVKAKVRPIGATVKVW